jgi:thiol:disulfide interchange protein
MGIESVNEFRVILNENKSLVILKFGAEWCGPCRRIEPQLHQWFNRMNALPGVQTFLIDIDENFEIYAYLKNKKMLIGVPAILMYSRDNGSFIPDDSVNTSNEMEIEKFFLRCIEKHNSLIE